LKRKPQNGNSHKESDMPEKTIGDFKTSWAILVALTALAAVLGIVEWESWRQSVDPPGLVAGMGLIATVAGLALAAWFAFVCAAQRNGAIIKPFAVWTLAAFIGIAGLGFYALPDYPAWGFYTTTAIAGLMLYAMNPWGRR
jgi:hypothetical protein